MAERLTPELERAIKEAVERKATDIFFLPNEPVSFRVGGNLMRSDEAPLSSLAIRDIAAAAIGQERLSRIGIEIADIVTPISIPGKADGRMSIAKSLGNFTLTIQLMPSLIPDVTAIKIPESLLKAALGRSGLIVFSGAVGSGKTTTLYSVAEYINANRHCSICSVEDPIHYKIKPKLAIVSQREVGIDAPDTASGIISALRQYPDVLIITELRSANDLWACAEAVESGVVVLIQVSAPSIFDAIRSLIDLVEMQTASGAGVARRRLAGIISAVSVQKLFPKTSGDGRIAAYGVLIPGAETRKAIASEFDKYTAETFESEIRHSEGSQTIKGDIERLAKENTIARDVK